MVRGNTIGQRQAARIENPGLGAEPRQNPRRLFSEQPTVRAFTGTVQQQYAGRMRRARPSGQLVCVGTSSQEESSRLGRSRSEGEEYVVIAIHSLGQKLSFGRLSHAASQKLAASNNATTKIETSTR